MKEKSYIKELALVLIIVCLGVIIYYFVTSQKQVPVVSNISTNTTTQEAPSAPAVTATRTTLHVPVDIFHDTHKGSVIASTTNGIVLSSQIANSNSINPVLDLLENGSKIGETQTEIIASVSFSPDNNYIGFRSINHLGVSDFQFALGVADLINKHYIYIYPPDISKANVVAWPKDAPLSLYIDSYTWEGNSVNIILFYVSSDGSTYYRVSPEETWNYNFETNKYTKISS